MESKQMQDAIKIEIKNKNNVDSSSRPIDSLFWITDEPHHLSLIGQRKYFSLYLATNLLHTQRNMLIKFIQPQWLNHHLIHQKFMNESYLLRSLHAPGFPAFMTQGLFHDQPYFCYTWPEGKLLSRHLAESDLFPLQSLRSIGLSIMTQLLQRIIYIHERINPIAHGDINPENLLLDTRQKLHIIDFSYSYFIRATSQKNTHWTGASAYLSPEQALGKPWGRASDIYQLGIVCYEWFTGQRWNKGKSIQDRKKNAASAHAPRAAFLVQKGLSHTLAKLITQMLNPTPAQRPSAVWLLEQLQSDPNS